MERKAPPVVTLETLREGRQRAQESTSGEAIAQTPQQRLALARYLQIMQRIRQETKDVGNGIMITVPDREASLAQSKLAEDGALGSSLASGGAEVKFGTGVKGGDWWGWMKSLVDWVDCRDARAMKRPTDLTIAKLSDVATIALAADWGTGLYGAPKIADSIRVLATERPFDLLMHLGDVYYSGTPDEVRDRFLAFWPTEAGRVSRTLNSNHEMYSGGYGYFDVALPALEQESSYFALRNRNWLLIALDTAYVDHDIDGEQVAWLNLVVSEALALNATMKIVLFSHQQPFSRLDAQGPKLQKALRHHLEAKRIKAWYWGHEHQCVIYDPHPNWGLLGRCLGHGGIPEPRNNEVTQAPDDQTHAGSHGCVWKRLAATFDSPACIALDGPNMDMQKQSDREKFVPHGFMTLEFNGERLIERALLSTGETLYENTIT